MSKEIKVDRNKKTKERKFKALVRNTIFLIVLAIVSIILYFIITSNKRDLREDGVGLYKQGNYEQAVECFDNASNEKQILSDSIDADILMYKIDCLIRLNKYNDANEVLMTLTNDYDKKYYDEENVQFLLRICNALDEFYNGSYDDSQVVFDEAISKGFIEMNLHGLVCAEQKGDYVGMMQYIVSYESVFGRNSLTAYKASSYYLNNDQPELAVEYIEEGKNLSDTQFLQQILLNEIIYYEKILDFNKAFDLATIFISQYPDDSNGLNEYEILKTRNN